MAGTEGIATSGLAAKIGVQNTSVAGVMTNLGRLIKRLLLEEIPKRDLYDLRSHRDGSLYVAAQRLPYVVEKLSIPFTKFGGPQFD